MTLFHQQICWYEFQHSWCLIFIWSVFQSDRPSLTRLTFEECASREEVLSYLNRCAQVPAGGGDRTYFIHNKNVSPWDMFIWSWWCTCDCCLSNQIIFGRKSVFRASLDLEKKMTDQAKICEMSHELLTVGIPQPPWRLAISLTKTNTLRDTKNEKLVTVCLGWSREHWLKNNHTGMLSGRFCRNSAENCTESARLLLFHAHDIEAVKMWSREASSACDCDSYSPKTT